MSRNYRAYKIGTSYHLVGNVSIKIARLLQLVLMKLLVNKVDDSEPKPHFTSIIAPLPVKSYYRLVTITAVNVNNTFKVFNSPPYHTRHFGFKIV